MLANFPWLYNLAADSLWSHAHCFVGCADVGRAGHLVITVLTVATVVAGLLFLLVNAVIEMLRDIDQFYPPDDVRGDERGSTKEKR